jgi:hypothetical protein
MSYLHLSLLGSQQEESMSAYDHLDPRKQAYQEDAFLPRDEVKGHGSIDAKPLHSGSQKFGSLCADLGCILVCLGLFVFAMLAYRSNGHVLGSYERDLINTARIVGQTVHLCAVLTFLPRSRPPSPTSLHSSSAVASRIS